MRKFKSDTSASAVLTILLVSVLFLASCEEGIFNFNDETGNFSLSFLAESVGTSLNELTVTFTNEDTNANIEKTVEIEQNGDLQEAELYLSRIDTGGWKIHIKITDKDGTVVAESDDYFELLLGETVIVEIEYFASGGIDLSYEKPAGSQPESLIRIDKLDTLIAAFHNSPNPVEQTDTGVTVIAQGAGFDSALTGVKAVYPDNSYFNYGGGFSRTVGGIEVEIDTSSLTVTRAGYSSGGNYSLSLTDTNDVEITETDDCGIGFDAKTSFLTINETPYAGGLILSTMYQSNSVGAGQTVFAYIVRQTDGNMVSEANLTVLDAGATDFSTYDFGLNTASANITGQQCWVVIVTTDLDFTTANDPGNGINARYQADSPDMLPDKIPGWLYMQYGDQLNYTAVSITEWTF